jgi:hypothetical protein
VKKKKINNRRTSGKSSQKVARRTYTPISDALARPFVFADCELSEGIKRHSLVNLFSRMFGKARREDAEPLPAILVSLLIWPLLKVPSIHSFCCELCHFLQGRNEEGQRKHDILYGILRREDINWRNLAASLSRKVGAQINLGPVERRAFVVDDSIKTRRGKKVEGSSSHWDHTEGRTVRGHQVVELGVAGEPGFVPLDRQIFMGEKNAVDKPEDKGFRDKRSAAARDMARAKSETKHTMFRRMLAAAIKAGHRAKYVLGDAWFGCKENIASVLECGLEAIFQIKRGLMKYRIDDPNAPEATPEGICYTAHQLYEKHKRKMRKAGKTARYKTCRLVVWINLETEAHRQPQWRQVVVVLSAPVKQQGPNPNDRWVIFLCTELKASAEHVLSIYSLRWSIEVYFKEAKQNFGWLAEQSGRYEYSYASAHLAAMRYTLLFEAMLRNGSLSYGEMRDRQTGALQVLSYAALLWQLFRAIIEGSLDTLRAKLGRRTIDGIMAAIDEEVDAFLSRALQIDPGLIDSQIKAEDAGYL